jgi:putative sigma-54 modulation protein
MDYQLYSKNVIVTDSLKEYLDMRFVHVDKISVDPISCRVDISRDAHHRKGDIFRVEINMNVPGKLLRIVEQHADARAAIDLATEKLARQLKKFKNKKIDLKRRFARLARPFKHW